VSVNDEIGVPVTLPLDSDGFLRRECPSCEQQFKWYSHDEGDSDAAVADQYFCPLCGIPSGIDTWWTPEQVEFAQRAVGPAIDQQISDAVASTFKGLKGLEFKPNRNFSLDIPTPEPLHEPDDMIIAEPPCHPNEPVKVSQTATARLHCLVCGSSFAV
jgi:hypothetical protein